MVFGFFQHVFREGKADPWICDLVKKTLELENRGRKWEWRVLHPWNHGIAEVEKDFWQH